MSNFLSPGNGSRNRLSPLSQDNKMHSSSSKAPQMSRLSPFYVRPKANLGFRKKKRQPNATDAASELSLALSSSDKEYSYQNENVVLDTNVDDMDGILDTQEAEIQDAMSDLALDNTPGWIAPESWAERDDGIVQDTQANDTNHLKSLDMPQSQKVMREMSQADWSFSPATPRLEPSFFSETLENTPFISPASGRSAINRKLGIDTDLADLAPSSKGSKDVSLASPAQSLDLGLPSAGTLFIQLAPGRSMPMFLPVNITAREIIHRARSQYGNVFSIVHLYMVEHGYVRRIPPEERPVLQLINLLNQTGYSLYEDPFGTTAVFDTDTRHVAYLTFEALEIDPSWDIAGPLHDVDLSEWASQRISIALFNRANEIEHLILSHNQLLDLPSDFLGVCSNLTHVYLSNVRLDAVPSALKKVAATLVHLDIEHNLISDLSPLVHLGRLESILAGNNRLFHIPESLVHLENLRYIKADNNYVTSVHLRSSTSQLEVVDLSYNDLHAFECALPHVRTIILPLNKLEAMHESLLFCTRLSYLDVSANRLRKFLNALHSLPCLRRVNVDKNPNLVQLIEPSPHEQVFQVLSLRETALTSQSLLFFAPSLRVLLLSHLLIATLPDTFFDNFPNLQVLHLDSNMLQALPKVRSPMPLRFLNIRNNMLSYLPQLSDFAYLEHLDASHNQLVDIPSDIWRIPLVYLNMSSNMLSVFPAEPISPSPCTLSHTLRVLKIAGNDIASVDSIASLSSLTCLDLSMNGLREISDLGPLKSMRELYLSNNLLTSLGPEIDIYFPCLQVLHANDNRLASLPNGFSRLFALKDVDVSNNLLDFNFSNVTYEWNFSWNLALRSLNLAGNPRLKACFTSQVMESNPITPLDQLSPYVSSVAKAASQAHNWSSNQISLDLLEHLSLVDISSISSESVYPASIPLTHIRNVHGLAPSLMPFDVGISEFLGSYSLETGIRVISENLVQQFRDQGDEMLLCMFCEDAVAQTDKGFCRRERVFSGLPITTAMASLLPSALRYEISRSSNDIANALRRALLQVNAQVMSKFATGESLSEFFSKDIEENSANDQGSDYSSIASFENANGRARPLSHRKKHDEPGTCSLGAASSAMQAQPTRHIHTERDPVTSAWQLYLAAREQNMEAHSASALSMALANEISASSTSLSRDGFYQVKDSLPKLRQSVVAGQRLLPPENKTCLVSCAIAYLKDTRLIITQLGSVNTVFAASDGSMAWAAPLDETHSGNSATELARVRQNRGYFDKKGLCNGLTRASRSLGYAHRAIAPPYVAPSVVEVDLVAAHSDIIIIANGDFWDLVPAHMAVEKARQAQNTARSAFAASNALRDLALSFCSEPYPGIMVQVLFRLDVLQAQAPHGAKQMSASPSSTRFVNNQQTAPMRTPPSSSPASTFTTPGIRMLSHEKKAPTPLGKIALVFSDVRDSTWLWENEASARACIQIHNRILRRHIAAVKGYEVKTEGDSFMVAFQNISQAVLWCTTVQLALRDEDWPAEFLKIQYSEYDHPDERGLSVRMGVHVGEAICEVDPLTRRIDYLGPMVNRTARIQGMAKGGHICVSDAAMHDLRAELDSYPQKDSTLYSQISALQAKNLYTANLGRYTLRGLTGKEAIWLILPEKLAYRANTGLAPLSGNGAQIGMPWTLQTRGSYDYISLLRHQLLLAPHDMDAFSSFLASALNFHSAVSGELLPGDDLSCILHAMTRTLDAQAAEAEKKRREKENCQRTASHRR